MKKICLLLCLLLVVGTFSACGGKSDSNTIVVGSKDFTEGKILSELYALALEDAGYKVSRKFDLQTALIHSAIVNKEVDFYPEYTGTGLLTVLKMDPIFDPDAVYDTVKKEYKAKFNIDWLNRSNVNDGQGLVITQKASDAYGIKTLSDLQQNAKQIRFASQGEFDDRSDGLPALVAKYGEFDFKSKAVFDNSLKYDVLKQDEADVTVCYTTEGQLASGEFLVLEDDKKVWPPYHIAPIIRGEVLSGHADLAELINAITAQLTPENVIQMNAKVDLDQQEYEDVAKEFFVQIRDVLPI